LHSVGNSLVFILLLLLHILILCPRPLSWALRPYSLTPMPVPVVDRVSPLGAPAVLHNVYSSNVLVLGRVHCLMLRCDVNVFGPSPFPWSRSIAAPPLRLFFFGSAAASTIAFALIIATAS